MTLGEAFKRFRRQFHVSQKQAAEAGGVTYQSYQTYEYEQSSPTVKVIINIAQAYGVSMDYLTGRSDMPHPINFDEREVKAAFAFRDAWLEAMRLLPSPPTK